MVNKLPLINGASGRFLFSDAVHRLFCAREIAEKLRSIGGGHGFICEAMEVRIEISDNVIGRRRLVVEAPAVLPDIAGHILREHVDQHRPEVILW